TSNSENAQSAVEEVIESKYINTNSLNIRDKPNGHVVGKLGRGEKVDIYETKGNWARISLNSSSPQWLSTKLLCETDGCFKQKSRSTTSNNYQALKSHPHHSERKQKKTYYDSDCSCAVVDYCVGPRGGHYCITSGGNKRYKPRY
ncbi:SH3 domain-containing protein, partial [Acinetobacter baumannii]